MSIDPLLAATAPLLGAAFTVAGNVVSWLELAGLQLSLWMVLCNLRVQPLAWPLAMASSAAYGVLFLHSKLYGEAGLQVLFIVLALWGWWQWLRGTGDAGRPLVADSDVPFLDALPTVGSITGQVLLARKCVENWPVWVAVNMVSVGLFAVKGLWLTVGLYLLFTLLALVGWRAWSTLALQSARQGAARG